MVFLASELEAARASLPVAAALAPHAEAFRAFAADRKLSLFTTPLAAWGAIDAFTFMARCVRLAPGSFGVEVALHFQDPAQNFVGSLRPSTSNDGPRTAPTGDPVFDNGFVVEGAGLAAALTAEARADVLELARTGHEVILGAAGLHLRATLRDQPYALEQHVEHALSAMRAIDSARRPATYR